MQYAITYTYDNPSGAGPFKGRMIVSDKPAKGDTVFAMFGRATIKTVRAIVPPKGA